MEKIIIGKKPLIDCIHQHHEIRNVYLLKAYPEIVNLLNKERITWEIVDPIFFNKYTKDLNHQGCIAIIEKDNLVNTLEQLFEFTEIKKQNLVVMLDEINDPRNFGAILRTCESFKVDGVIYKKDNQAQINDLVIKTSMGSINNLNLIRVVNLSNTIEQFKKNGYWVVATSLENAVELGIQKFDFKTLLIVGNEDRGVSRLLLEKADFKVKIPTTGLTQSLNVSVATGILLYEIAKKQNN